MMLVGVAMGWGWGPRGPCAQGVADPDARASGLCGNSDVTETRKRGNQETPAWGKKEGMCAVRTGDGWPRKPAQPSKAEKSRAPALTFPRPLVTSHLPPSQDAAGPPGPLCASSSARLRLAGAPLRQDQRRAQAPEPSGAVVAPTRSPEARSARPCP